MLMKKYVMKVTNLKRNVLKLAERQANYEIHIKKQAL